MKRYEFYREGKKIYGELIVPRGNKDKWPTVVLCHGFGGNMEGERPYADYFAGKGIATFLFDFIGGGRDIKSDGSMLEMTVLTEAEDLKVVLGEVAGMPEVDEERIFLMGASQGGYVASIVAPEVQSMIRAMVNLYPGFVIPDDALKRMNAPGYDPEHIRVMGYEISHKYNVDATSFDGVERAAGYTGKVLMIHGTADSIVPITYSEKALEAYEDAELLRIPGAGHGFSGNDFEMAAAAAADFILENC